MGAFGYFWRLLNAVEYFLDAFGNFLDDFLTILEHFGPY